MRREDFGFVGQSTGGPQTMTMQSSLPPHSLSIHNGAAVDKESARCSIDVGLVVILLLIHGILRYLFLPQLPDQLVGGLSEVISELYSRNLASLLLPIPIDAAHRIHWTTTGLVLVEGIRRIIGLSLTYFVASS